MKAQTSTAHSRELGEQLRRARHRAGFDGRELSYRLGWSQSKLSLLEHGHRGTCEADVVLYLGYCRADRETVARALELVRERDIGYLVRPHEAHLSDSLCTLILHESTASLISKYEPMVIPGLLQTAEYARAMIAGAAVDPPDAVEALVQARMARQRVLSGPWPPQSTFFVHEAALRCSVGGAQIMHEQLLRLVLMCSWQHMTIRVVPFVAGGSPLLRSGFTLMEHPDHGPVAYVETDTASLFLEKRETITCYRRRLTFLADRALDGGESRSLLARWASRYDQPGEDRHDDPPPGTHNVA